MHPLISAISKQCGYTTKQAGDNEHQMEAIATAIA